MLDTFIYQNRFKITVFVNKLKTIILHLNTIDEI